MFFLGSCLDLLDGTLARVTHQTIQAGVLDSTLDRVSESAIFSAIAYVFAELGNLLDVALIFAAALTAFLISYVRARAEKLEWIV